MLHAAAHLPGVLGYPREPETPQICETAIVHELVGADACFARLCVKRDPRAAARDPPPTHRRTRLQRYTRIYMLSLLRRAHSACVRIERLGA